MSTWSNYDDVLDQLRSAGFLDRYGNVMTAVETGTIVRCRIEGEGKKNRAWYRLHEWHGRYGDTLLVGSYGIFRGPEKFIYNIDLKGFSKNLDAEERKAIKDRMAADRKADEAKRKAVADKAARRAAGVWTKCADSWVPRGGEETRSCSYLVKKGIDAHGTKFTPTGAIVVPMRDIKGSLRALQFIFSKDTHAQEIKKNDGNDKKNWPYGAATKGLFHLIGPSPAWLVIVVEGLATGESIHKATGYTVAVAFNAGNLEPVADALRKERRWISVKILIAADDDWLCRCPGCQKYTPVAVPACEHCDTEHKKFNGGISFAQKAAFAVGGEWVAPKFSDRGNHKWTDFNDLDVIEGSTVVSAQINEKLLELGWDSPSAAPSTPPQGMGERAAKLRPIEWSDELLERFALVYAHKQTVFDSREHILMALGDMRDACIHKDVHRRWMENPARRIVRVEEVGFDPAGTDPKITCNLFGGWPTTPKKGKCDMLLDLLEYLCSAEGSPEDIKRWILCWLAYPIQNPGAKMKTALVLHGPQGVGKNLFFEAVMSIYGEYGRIINQDAVEDKYNDWASKKLYLIADEVVARQELYHTKNKLKGLITNDTIRINPKFVTSYEERNHVNLVFLSNETLPLVLDRDDRRYTVVWTPPKLSAQMYVDVGAEIEAGGIEALHHFLKHEIDLDTYYDNKPFTPHTKPPMTKAKAELIDLGQDNTERFWLAWLKEEIDGKNIPVVPCLSQDFYDLYRSYCGRIGYPRYAPQPKLMAELGKRSDCTKQRCWYLGPGGRKQGTFVFPPHASEPVGDSQELWLSKCVDKFKEGVQEWKSKDAP